MDTALLPSVDQNSAGPSEIEFDNGSQLAGLSYEEARERLKTDGPNELPSSRPRSVAAIAWEVVKEPIFLLLVACGTIYLFLGDKQEALMLLGFVFAGHDQSQRSSNSVGENQLAASDGQATQRLSIAFATRCCYF